MSTPTQKARIVEMKAIQWLRRVDREQCSRVLIGFGGTVLANCVIAAVGRQVIQLATGV
jgi:capsular polysaccharide biosynthesis protein